MLCSQPNRGALRRQARIDQQGQEQHHDPWVRLSDSSTEDFHHSHVSGRIQTVTRLGGEPAAMSEEEDTKDLNGTVREEGVDPPPDAAPENISETPQAAKKGPPVAPKPAWFRQSLKKIQGGQSQRTPDKTPEQKPLVSFSRGFGVRSAPPSSNLSIKQKIHSFETFSSSSGPEKGNNRRPSATSPSVTKEPRSHHGSQEDDLKVVPKRSQDNVAPGSGETDDTESKAKPSANTTCTSEAQTTAPETDHAPIQSPGDHPHSDITDTSLDSDKQACLSDPGCTNSRASPPTLESESESEGFSRPTDIKDTPPKTSSAPQTEEEGAPDRTEEPVMQIAPTAAATEDHDPQKGLDGESKILTFSHKVTCHARNYVKVLL